MTLGCSAVVGLGVVVVGGLLVMPWMIPIPGAPAGRTNVSVGGDPLNRHPPTGGGILCAVVLGMVLIFLFGSVK